MAISTEKAKEMREILLDAEVKRQSERITKTELCSIYKMNSNFYINCCGGRDKPSKVMVESLNRYLETETSEVYKLIFAKREIENTFHKKTELTLRELVDKFKECKEKGFYHLEKFEAEEVLNSYAQNLALLNGTEVDEKELEELREELGKL